MVDAAEARSRIEFQSMEQILKQWEDIENAVELSISRGLSKTLMWGRIHQENKESLEDLGYIVEQGVDCYSVRWDEEVKKEDGTDDSD